MTLWSRLRQRLGIGHLGDDELLELLMPPGSDMPPASARLHLERCEVCVSRSTKLRTFLNSLVETNETNVAGAFPLDRLATQRERIMRRLRRAVEPAKPTRVLRFPALGRPTLAGAHPARRWLGAASVAGLLVGVSVGQLLHVHPVPAITGQNTAANTMVSPAVSAFRRSSPASYTDPILEDEDPFLDELEFVLNNPQVPGLSPLDEITPRIREVAVNVW